MRNVIVLLFLVPTIALAGEKPLWKAGCVSLFSRVTQATGLPMDPKEIEETSQARCGKVKATINWDQVKNTRFDGCADAAKYLLDGAGVADPHTRRQRLVNFCM